MGGLQELALGYSEVNKDWILWTDEMKGETGTRRDRQGGKCSDGPHKKEWSKQ